MRWGDPRQSDVLCVLGAHPAEALQPWFAHRLPVDKHRVPPRRDRLARQADYALNEVPVLGAEVLGGRLKTTMSPRWIVYLEVTRNELISYLQRRPHGARRHVEGLGDRGCGSRRHC